MQDIIKLHPPSHVFFDLLSQAIPCNLPLVNVISSNLSQCYSLGWGVPKRTENGNRPIFSTKFGNFVHILADYENRNIAEHGNFLFDRYLTDISNYLERISESVPLRTPPSFISTIFNFVAVSMAMSVMLKGGVLTLLHQESMQIPIFQHNS